MAYDFDLAIIGGGSAGLLAAEVAPRMGVKTALIERSRLGGDCLWTGCVPSKALLASAHVAHQMRHADRFGLPAVDVAVDTTQVWRRIHEKQALIANTDDNPERYRSLGVDVIFGNASFRDSHAIRAGDRTVTARYVLICTGSRPVAPPIAGLEELAYLTSESVFELERAPRSLIVVGGGPIGVELAQAMARLGVRTTLLEQLPRLLARDEPELAAVLLATLRAEGVDVGLGVDLTRAERAGEGKRLTGRVDGREHVWEADEILVAAGRKANVDALGLERIGVKTGPTGVVVDAKLRTTVPHIYAVGDCAGRYFFTHSAGAETGVALRNMFYPGSDEAPDLIPWTTFTDPELAHVGMTLEEAQAKLGARRVRAVRWDWEHSDRARVEEATEGRVVVVADTGHKILGAHILAPGAGEMIGQFTLAIAEGARLTPELRSLVQVYPTFSTSFSSLAGEAVYEQLRKPAYRALRFVNDLLAR